MKKCLCRQTDRVLNAEQATMSFLAEVIPPSLLYNTSFTIP